MKMPRPSENAREAFSALVPDEPAITLRPMFGNLAAFVNGNMFMGLFGPAIGVKLAAPDQETLLQAGGGPFGPEERPMGGYVSLPTGMKEGEAKRWVTVSLAHVAALPEKKKRANS